MHRALATHAIQIPSGADTARDFQFHQLQQYHSLIDSPQQMAKGPRGLNLPTDKENKGSIKPG